MLALNVPSNSLLSDGGPVSSAGFDVEVPNAENDAALTSSALPLLSADPERPDCDADAVADFGAVPQVCLQENFSTSDGPDQEKSGSPVLDEIIDDIEM